MGGTDATATEPQSNIYETVKGLVGGDVAVWLGERRQKGWSYARITRDLQATTGVIVSIQVIHKWAKALGVEDKAS